jgi:hypothetical protein
MAQSEVKYGKREPEYDERTVQFARFMDPYFHAPVRWDFDKHRAEFPLETWGSDKYKCDVLASQANQLLRLGRLGEKRTISITSQNVVSRYRLLSKSRKNGDDLDKGLSVLQAMKAWRRGWNVKERDYPISLYGEIDPAERDLLRTAIHIFKGVHFGFWLPREIEGNFRAWHYNGDAGEKWRPGSLGGTLAYCKAYDIYSYEIIAWGTRIRVSNEFVEKYCDECWVCIEALDYWSQQVLDIERMFATFPELMATVKTEEIVRL